MTRPEPGRWAHAEAYCLMTYRSDDGTEEEVLWNSRDGVTPFVITLPSGKQATHVNWAADIRMPPGWQPPAGMRVFTDLTPEAARGYAERNVDRWAAEQSPTGDLFRETYPDRAAAVDWFAAEYAREPGAPDIAVTPCPECRAWPHAQTCPAPDIAPPRPSNLPWEAPPPDYDG